MNRTTVLKYMLVLGLFVLVAGATSKKELKKAYKTLDKEYPAFVFIPGVSLSLPNQLLEIAPFWMSKYEVTNGKWQEFVADVRQRVKGDSFKNLLPDTNCWTRSNAYNEPMKTYYYSHPAYYNYPVVGVSIEQCNEYCKWLQEKMESTEMSAFKSLTVRLPTDEEWEHAANGGEPTRIYPFGTYLRNSKGVYLANFRKLDQGSARKVGDYIVLKESFANYNASFLTAPVDMYFENDFGLFHMAGNVSEFVLPPKSAVDNGLEDILKEKGISRGGSFFEPAYYMKCSVRDFYPRDSSASFSRGFRPVLSIKEE